MNKQAYTDIISFELDQFAVPPCRLAYQLFVVLQHGEAHVRLAHSVVRNVYDAVQYAVRGRVQQRQDLRNKEKCATHEVHRRWSHIMRWKKITFRNNWLRHKLRFLA